MTGQSRGRALDASEVYGLLAALGLERSGPGHAVVLAVGTPPTVVWANRAATALFGTNEAGPLGERLFRAGGRDGIADVGGRLVPDGGARTERLRLFDGFRARTVTLSVGCTRLADGTDVLVITAPPRQGDEAGDAHRDALEQPPGRADVSTTTATPGPAPGPDSVAVSAPARPVDLVPRRFLWQTDAAGRLLRLAGPSGDLADLDPAVALGDMLAARADRSLSGAPELQAALGLATAFSGVKLTWPLANGAGAVEVTMGATPIRGAQGEQAGLRGFGVIDYRRLIVEQPRADAREQQAEPGVDVVVSPGAATPDEVPPSPETDPPHEAEPENVVAARSTGEQPAPAVEGSPIGERSRYATGVRASFSSAKIVALHPDKMVSGTAPVASATGASATLLRRRGDAAPDNGEDAPDPVPSAEGANLSSVEQFNFDEIARALRNAAADTVASSSAAGPSVVTADDSAALLAALPVPLLVDRSGRIVYANAAFLELTGYASARAIDRVGGRTHLLGGLDAAQVAGSEEDRAFPIVGAAGDVISVVGRVAVIAWGGVPAELMTVRLAGDRIAEVQSLQIEVRRREQECSDYRALIDGVSDAVVTVDAQGRLLTMNIPAERLFARDERGTAGESIGLLLTPDCQSAALGAIVAAGAAGPEGTEAGIGVTGRRPDTSTMPLRMLLRPLAPGRIGIVLRDESEVDTLRDDLQQSRAAADQSGTMRSAFLAKVSHEIRTPLNTIIGFAEIMLDERFGAIGSPRYKDYLGDIRAAGQHVIDLVADLLDLSAMQAGRHDFTVAAMDVNRIVSESVAALQDNAHRDRIIVRSSLMPQLPSALIDERALRQILANVLSNAIRFNEPGGQVIVSTAVTEMNEITIKIRDTGLGMSDAELAVAMEPFRQISTGKPGGGSGLGLPLTRALVDANQATMSIRSRKGEGTLVEIVLRPAHGAPVSVPAA